MTKTICKMKETENGVDIKFRDGNETYIKNFPFNNYFYIKEEIYDSILFAISNRILDEQIVVDRNGATFIKLYLRNNFHRTLILNEIDEAGYDVYEGDINASKRVLIDNNIPLNQEGLRIAFYDIETNDLEPFVKDKKGEIVPLSAITSMAVKEFKKNAETKTWYVRNKGVDGSEFDEYRKLRREYLDLLEKGLPTIEISKKLKEWKELVDTALWKGEETLLIEYQKYIKQFDVISAWNGRSFDDAYVRFRFKSHKMNYENLWINGFDYMECYKKNHYGAVKSFALNNVAYQELKSELGKENSSLKFPEEIKKLDWRKTTNCEKYFDLFLLFPEVHKEYNIQDVKLLEMLEEKLGFFKLHFVQCKKAHCLLVDTLYNSRICDFLILNECKKRNIIKISKPTKEEIDKRGNKNVPGGFTFCYKPGLHWSVKCFDFASHYVNIIRTFNISSENYIRTVAPDLSKVFNIKEVEFVNYAVDIAKKYVDKTNKLQKKKYEQDLLEKREELGVEDMEALMWKFIRNYNQNIEHSEKESYTPSDINYDTRGWNIHPHFVFDKTERAIYPTILDTLIVERDEVKYSLKKYEKGSFEWTEHNLFQTGLKLLGNCFSLDTEIMTVDGPKNVRDIKVGDKCWSLNKETNEVEEATVIEEIYQPHNGEMIHFKNKNTDLLVTPNHRMLRQRYKKKNWECEAQDCMNGLSIPLHKNKPFRKFEKEINLLDFINKSRYEIKDKKVRLKLNFPNNFTKQGVNNFVWNDYKINVEDFSRIVGWYIADGSLHKTSKNGFNISIAKRTHTKERKKIEKVLDRIGHITKTEGNLHFASALWYDILKQFGSYGYEKHIPDKFKKYLDYDILFESLYECNGNKKTWRYSTTSDRLKDNMKEICFYVGRTFNGKLEKQNRPNTKDVWRIYCSFIKNGKHIHKRSITKVSDKKKYDYVACITLDKNNTVYAGRNNTFTWTYQSIYGFTGFRASRDYRIEIPTAITSSARYMTKICMLELWDNDMEITHGDSVTGDSKINLMNDVKNIETLWNLNKNKIKKIRGKEVKDWDNSKVLTCNNKFKNIFVKPEQVIRHKVNKQIYRVKLSSGDSIDITEDHSLILEENGKFIETKPSKDLREVLFNCKIPTKNKDNCLSKELYNFLGMVVANGGVEVGSSIYLSFNYMKKYIKKIIKPLSVEYNFSIPKIKKNGFDIRIMSKHFSEFIYDLGFSGTSKSKRIPQWLFEETEENIIEFLNGYMSGDGSIFGSGSKFSVKCSSVSFDLMKDFKRLFELCGIGVSFRDDKIKNKYKGKETGTTMKELVLLNTKDFANKFYMIGKSDRMKFLKSSTDNDFIKRRVISIRKINMKPTYVYDLSIPKYQKFYANSFLVHNTDSAYCVGDKSVDFLDAKFKELIDRKMIPFNTMKFDNKKHSINFEFEDEYKAMIPIKRKRYYYYNNGKVGGKGGVNVRSDVLQLTKDLQEELLIDIFTKKFDKDVWIEKLTKLKNKVFNKELEEEHLIKISGLGRPIESYGKAVIDGKTGLQKLTKEGKPRFAPVPAIVQIAKKLLAEGQNIDVGSKIKYIVAESKPKIRPITLKEYRKTKEYDAKYYYERIIRGVLEILKVTHKDLVYNDFAECWGLTKRQIIGLKKKQGIVEDDE